MSLLLTTSIEENHLLAFIPDEGELGVTVELNLLDTQTEENTLKLVDVVQI